MVTLHNHNAFSCPFSRESPVDCSVTKRSRHMSNDGAAMPYQATYVEPRVSPQTTSPPSSTTEEKRVIVPAGERAHWHELAVTGASPSQDTFPTAGTRLACAMSITESEMGTACVCASRSPSSKHQHNRVQRFCSATARYKSRYQLLCEVWSRVWTCDKLLWTFSLLSSLLYFSASQCKKD